MSSHAPGSRQQCPQPPERKYCPAFGNSHCVCHVLTHKGWEIVGRPISLPLARSEIPCCPVDFHRPHPRSFLCPPFWRSPSLLCILHSLRYTRGAVFRHNISNNCLYHALPSLSILSQVFKMTQSGDQRAARHGHSRKAWQGLDSVGTRGACGDEQGIIMHRPLHLCRSANS